MDNLIKLAFNEELIKIAAKAVPADSPNWFTRNIIVPFRQRSVDKQLQKLMVDQYLAAKEKGFTGDISEFAKLRNKHLKPTSNETIAKSFAVKQNFENSFLGRHKGAVALGAAGLIALYLLNKAKENAENYENNMTTSDLSNLYSSNNSVAANLTSPYVPDNYWTYSNSTPIQTLK